MGCLAGISFRSSKFIYEPGKAKLLIISHHAIGNGQLQKNKLVMHRHEPGLQVHAGPNITVPTGHTQLHVSETYLPALQPVPVVDS